jgi:hypothetical protein
MSRVTVSSFLRFSLLLDAAVSGLMGLLLLIASGPLATLLRLPETLLFGAGVFFVPYVAVVAWMGLRTTLLRGAVWAVIACNVLWALDCGWLLMSGMVTPNSLGVAFVIVQAVAVLVFAELQFTALRRERVAA